MLVPLLAALAACSLIESYPELAPDPGIGGGTGAGGAGGGSGGGGASTTTTGTGCAPMSTMPCYTGPANTEGIGLCVGGIATCLSDGSGYGPCEGETVPVQENCTTPEDEDCDGYGNCHGEAVWSLVAGDPLSQQGLAVADAGAAAVWITGTFSGALDLGGGPIPGGAGVGDMFLAKLSSSGAHLVSLGFGGGAGRALAVDAQGDVILAAACRGNVDFGGGVLSGPMGNTHDVCLARFTSSGSYVWAKRFGDIADQFPTGAAIDGSGNIVVVGSSQGTIDFGGGPLTSAGSYDLFIAKLDSTGSHLWSARFGGTLDQTANAVAVDAAGPIVVGAASGAIDFGGGALPPAGGDDIVVARLDPNGAHVWSRRYGGMGADAAYAVAIDGGGDVLVTGAFQGAVDFGNDLLIAAGGDDMFLNRLAPDGSPVIANRYGDGKDQAGLGVAIAADGGTLLTGRFAGTIDFGSGPFQATGPGNDIFLAKLDAGAMASWVKHFGDDKDQVATSIARSAAGPLLVTGIVDGSVDFGDGVHVAAGGQDVFVAAFLP